MFLVGAFQLSVSELFQPFIIPTNQCIPLQRDDLENYVVAEEMLSGDLEAVGSYRIIASRKFFANLYLVLPT